MFEHETTDYLLSNTNSIIMECRSGCKKIYNIYGESGVGKTGVLKEIEANVKSVYEKTVCLYIDFKDHNLHYVDKFLFNLTDEIERQVNIKLKEFAALRSCYNKRMNISENRRGNNIFGKAGAVAEFEEGLRESHKVKLALAFVNIIKEFSGQESIGSKYLSYETDELRREMPKVWLRDFSNEFGVNDYTLVILIDNVETIFDAIRGDKNNFFFRHWLVQFMSNVDNCLIIMGNRDEYFNDHKLNIENVRNIRKLPLLPEELKKIIKDKYQIEDEIIQSFIAKKSSGKLNILSLLCETAKELMAKGFDEPPQLISLLDKKYQCVYDLYIDEKIDFDTLKLIESLSLTVFFNVDIFNSLTEQQGLREKLHFVNFVRFPFIYRVSESEYKIDDALRSIINERKCGCKDRYDLHNYFFKYYKEYIFQNKRSISYLISAVLHGVASSTNPAAFLSWFNSAYEKYKDEDITGIYFCFNIILPNLDHYFDEFALKTSYDLWEEYLKFIRNYFIICEKSESREIFEKSSLYAVNAIFDIDVKNKRPYISKDCIGEYVKLCSEFIHVLVFYKRCFYSALSMYDDYVKPVIQNNKLKIDKEYHLKIYISIFSSLFNLEYNDLPRILYSNMKNIFNDSILEKINPFTIDRFSKELFCFEILTGLSGVGHTIPVDTLSYAGFKEVYEGFVNKNFEKIKLQLIDSSSLNWFIMPYIERVLRRSKHGMGDEFIYFYINNLLPTLLERTTFVNDEEELFPFRNVIDGYIEVIRGELYKGINAFDDFCNSITNDNNKIYSKDDLVLKIYKVYDISQFLFNQQQGPFAFRFLLRFFSLFYDFKDLPVTYKFKEAKHLFSRICDDGSFNSHEKSGIMRLITKIEKRNPCPKYTPSIKFLLKF